MRLTHLSITNFKNYARLQLDLTPGTTVIHGENAQGKTGFLEAIFYLSTVRAIGPQTDAQLINWVAQQSIPAYARLSARVQRATPPLGVQQFEVVISHEPLLNGGSMRTRKSLKVNGASQRTFDRVGKLPVVLFVPADLELVTGAPSERRRYLDNLIAQMDTRYAEALQLYGRVLQQRNQHLRQLQERGGASESVHMWDDQLVTHGTTMLLRRQDVSRTNS